jgi:hypothetical protein
MARPAMIKLPEKQPVNASVGQSPSRGLSIEIASCGDRLVVMPAEQPDINGLTAPRSDAHRLSFDSLH